MLRYYATAAALKFFGLNRATRAAYRALGNAAWSVRKPHTPIGNIRAAKAMVQRLRVAGLLDGRPLYAMEIGTGWMHFYAIVLALIVENVRVDLYDVWDNRQFLRLQRTFALVAPRLAELSLLPDEEMRAKKRIEVISEARSLDDIYHAFGFRYFADAEGTLASMPSSFYDVAFSFDVLEHVSTPALSVAAIGRILKPGGISLHEIGLEDHLASYDPKAAHKQFLSFSAAVWRMLNNDIQHMNLVCADEWRRMFAMELIETEFVPMGKPENLPVKVHPRFMNQSRESLFASRLAIVHRKAA